MAFLSLSKSSLKTDIADGNHTDQFLGHLAESGLNGEEVITALAETADAAANRYAEQAKIVEASVRGVESRTGGAEFEIGRSEKLKELSSLLRSFLP